MFEGGDRETASQVLDILIDARLLTSYDVPAAEGEERGQHRIEIIHESLLANWPRLVRWQTQDTEGSQLRDQLRQAAQTWVERGRPSDLLWSGTAFREFQLWRERYPGGLTETEESFATAMTSLATRRRRLRRDRVDDRECAVTGRACGGDHPLASECLADPPCRGPEAARPGPGRDGDAPDRGTRLGPRQPRAERHARGQDLRVEGAVTRSGRSGARSCPHRGSAALGELQPGRRVGRGRGVGETECPASVGRARRLGRRLPDQWVGAALFHTSTPRAASSARGRHTPKA